MLGVMAMGGPLLESSPPESQRHGVNQVVMGGCGAGSQGVTAGLHNPEEEWVHSSRARRSLHQS